MTARYFFLGYHFDVDCFFLFGREILVYTKIFYKNLLRKKVITCLSMRQMGLWDNFQLSLQLW